MKVRVQSASGLRDVELRMPVEILRIDLDSAPEVNSSDESLSFPCVLLALIFELNGYVEKELVAFPDIDAFRRYVDHKKVTRSSHPDHAQISSPTQSDVQSDVLPSVSVVVPSSLLRMEAVARSLRSLLDQTYPNYEVILVDNGRRACVDAYPELVSLDMTGRLRIVHERAPGVSFARNQGARSATGEIILCTDDDVVVPSTWIQHVVEEFARFPDASAVVGPILPYVVETDAQLRFESLSWFSHARYVEGLLDWDGLESRGIRRAGASRYGVGYLGTTANLAMRRSLWESLAGTRNFPNGSDLDLFLRVLDSGASVRRTSRAFVYHEHRQSQAELRRQIRNYGGAISALAAADLMASPGRSMVLYRTLPLAVRRILANFYERPTIGVDVYVHPWSSVEVPASGRLGLEWILGFLVGPFRMARARYRARRLSRSIT